MTMRFLLAAGMALFLLGTGFESGSAGTGAVTAWSAPSLVNGWSNFGGGFMTAGYMRDGAGRVYLRGLINGGTTTPGTVLFTLPTGYRPSATCLFAQMANGAISEIRIYSDGTVTIQTGTGWVSLEGMSFDSR